MTSTPASLLDRLTAGSSARDWDRFVDLYTPILIGWCRLLGLSDAEAADFTQDVFVVLVEHLPRFRYDPTKSFRAWLKTVLMNAWRNRRRRGAKMKIGPVDAVEIADADPASFIDDQEHNEYLVQRAMALMQQDFEPATWKACWEFVVNDRSASEVAAELGISVNSVYLAKSRVLRRLRTELRGLLD